MTDALGFLRRPLSAAHAAVRAAALHGDRLTDEAADAVVAAVLAYADGEHRVSQQVAPDVWNAMQQEDRDRLIRHLGADLAVRLHEQKLLPVALPREVITLPSSTEPWECIKVELVVPVRQSPGL